MIRNYLKIAFRNIWKNKGYAFINIVGLSVAFCISIFLFMTTYFQMSFDNFHQDEDRIFQTYLFYNDPDKAGRSGSMPMPLTPALKAEYPEVEAATRLMNGSSLVEYKGKYFDKQVMLVDADFLRVENHGGYHREKDQWDAMSHKTFVKLKPNVDQLAFENRLKSFSVKYFSDNIAKLKRNGAKPDERGDLFAVGLQKLVNLHFDREISGGSGSSMAVVYAILGIAFFILLIACIVFMLSQDFVKMVILSIIIATPLAWFAMQKWVGNHGYRIEISIWVFILVGMSAILVALATFSFQSIKAVLMNPVKSLRSE